MRFGAKTYVSAIVSHCQTRWHAAFDGWQYSSSRFELVTEHGETPVPTGWQVQRLSEEFGPSSDGVLKHSAGQHTMRFCGCSDRH